MAPATTRLAGKRALIVGGSSGIGYAVAEACLEAGMTVTIASSSTAKLSAAKSKLLSAVPSASDNELSTHAIDLSSASDLESNIAALLSAATASGPLDHVVHSAGDALPRRPLSETTVADLQQMPMVRHFAVIMLAKLAPAKMNPGPASSITFTTGSVSERPIPGWAVGNFFATGIHGLARGLALDLAPLRVNAVSPGAVETPLWDSIPAHMRETYLNRLKDGTCTGAVGAAEDVAEAYLYLMKDKNCTGSVVRTDGGGMLK